MGPIEITEQWRSEHHRSTAETLRNLAALHATLLASTWLVTFRLSHESWLVLAGCRAACAIGCGVGFVGWRLATIASQNLQERHRGLYRVHAVAVSACAVLLVVGTAMLAWVFLSRIL